MGVGLCAVLTWPFRFKPKPNAHLLADCLSKSLLLFMPAHIDIQTRNYYT